MAWLYDKSKLFIEWHLQVFSILILDINQFIWGTNSVYDYNIKKYIMMRFIMHIYLASHKCWMFSEYSKSHFFSYKNYLDCFFYTFWA